MYNFTLIIPTHNRHGYLERSVSYYQELKAEIIYCDSSENAYQGEINNNIKYLHLPAQKFGNKVMEALTHVKTQFVALCADDDFILIDALYEGVTTLEEDTRFKTVVGKYVAFSEKFDGNFYSPYQTLPSTLMYDPKKNATLFFRNYYQILWAMYDKNVLVKAFNIISQGSFKNDNFIEIVIGACACFNGGIKFLDIIWGVRELNIQDHWGARHKTISDVHSGQIKDDYQVFRRLLDEVTFKGYSKLVMDSYLYFSRNYFVYLKTCIRKVMPTKLLSYLKKTDPEKSVRPKVHLNNLEESRFKKIIEILQV